MPRNDMKYWSRLRKDTPSSWAAGLAFVALLAATLSVMDLTVYGASAESRGNPLYWLLMVPVVWWTSELAGFEPRAVRMLGVVTWLAPAIALTCLLIVFLQQEAWLTALVLASMSIVAAVGSRRFYARSLLRREGPSR